MPFLHFQSNPEKTSKTGHLSAANDVLASISVMDERVWQIFTAPLLARPAGIAMPQADLCFTNDFLFLNCRPSHLTTCARISTRIAALTPPMKNNSYG